jgi:hypothetical protein
MKNALPPWIPSFAGMTTLGVYVAEVVVAMPAGYPGSPNNRTDPQHVWSRGMVGLIAI